MSQRLRYMQQYLVQEFIKCVVYYSQMLYAIIFTDFLNGIGLYIVKNWF